jgi:hypothetical protein
MLSLVAQHLTSKPIAVGSKVILSDFDYVLLGGDVVKHLNASSYEIFLTSNILPMQPPGPSSYRSPDLSGYARQ